MFLFKLAVVVWPAAARRLEQKIEHELKLEEWNHEEEIFHRVPNTHFESHQERVVRLGPQASYARLWL